jgi:glycine/D-amino acid oxidase-like deaminating enzyme
MTVLSRPVAPAGATGAAPAVSHWLAQLGPLVPRAALEGDREADVCVVGAGFTGLWTAYELRRADPQLDVVVLESEFAGFGASGRNGGWVLGELAGPSRRWIAEGGHDGARAMNRAIQQTVDEIGAVVRREGIDCEFVKGGTLALARSTPQLARQAQERREAVAEAIGHEDAVVLDAAQTRERVAVAGTRGAVFSPHCARVDPARLIRGLADAVERAGATILERTRVMQIDGGAARTAHGVVRARHVVRATEGYTPRLPGLHRRLLPMNSSMIITEPLSEQAWSDIGWHGAETLRDDAHVYVYLQRTADGRIAIGGRGVPYRYGSQTDREGPVPPATVRELRERLISMFPACREARIDGAWHGVFGVARDWMPRVGIDRRTGLAWAGGYVGEGVAAANLAGRTLRDLILGRESELTRLPWVGSSARAWEPEPLRFLGARALYRTYRIADVLETRRGRPSAIARVADLVAGR